MGKKVVLNIHFTCDDPEALSEFMAAPELLGRDALNARYQETFDMQIEKITAEEVLTEAPRAAWKPAFPEEEERFNPKKYAIKNPDGPATEAQWDFLKVLATNREVLWVFSDLKAKGLTKEEASKIIEEAKKAPKRSKKTFAEGVYKGESGALYKVVTSKKGHLYAEQLLPGDKKTDPWKWTYLRGLLSAMEVDKATALDKHYAVSWGKMYSHCAVCGATLTDPDSIKAGIGPVCAKRL